MASRTQSRSAEEQAADLVRSLSQEIKKGIVEGVIILCLAFGMLGGSLAARSADPTRPAPAAVFWSSIPVIILGVSYFVRSYADSQVRREVNSIQQALTPGCAPSPLDRS